MKIKDGLIKGRVWIDPPQGWRYGFPKLIDLDTYDNAPSVKDLCISLGYPQEAAEAYGNFFYVAVHKIDIWVP